MNDHPFRSTAGSEWDACSTVLDPSAPDDAQARRLLQCAHGALQKWPEGFRGFSAAIVCRDGQAVIAGSVRVFTGGHVEFDLDGSAARSGPGAR